jgi:hypothetical protein
VPDIGVRSTRPALYDRENLPDARWDRAAGDVAESESIAVIESHPNHCPVI